MKYLTCLFLLITPATLFSLPQEKAPTVVFFSSYLLEASVNVDTLEFPLMPGKTSTTTLESVYATTVDYMDRLNSIYAFNHYSLLQTNTSCLFIDSDKDSSGIISYGEGPGSDFFSAIGVKAFHSDETGLPVHLSLSEDVGPEPMQRHSLILSPLIEMDARVQHGKPLVIGRPLPDSSGERKAIFWIFTAYFHRLTQQTPYQDLLDSYQHILKIETLVGDANGWRVFKKINAYYKNILKKTHLPELKEIIPPPPPPTRNAVKLPPPAFETPPVPHGGFQAIRDHLQYPKTAQKRGKQGRVAVYAHIDTLGQVTQTFIVQSNTDSTLDRAAAHAIRAIRWKPATLKGQPVAVWILIPVDFNLSPTEQEHP